MSAVLAVVLDPPTGHAPTYKLGAGRLQLWHGCVCRPGYWAPPTLAALHEGGDPDRAAGTIEKGKAS